MESAREEFTQRVLYWHQQVVGRLSSKRNHQDADPRSAEQRLVHIRPSEAAFISRRKLPTARELQLYLPHDSD